MFIAFDGIDGAGKSTQIRLIEKYCAEKGYEFQEIDFGSFPAIKPLLRKCSKGNFEIDGEAREGLYFLEGMLTDFYTTKAIKRNTIAVIDRYILTYKSYGILNGATQELVDAFCTTLTVPDLYFFLDLDPAIGMKRIAADRGKFELAEIGKAGKALTAPIENINKQYLAYQTQVRHKMIAACAEDYVKLDASQPAEDVSQAVIESIEAVIADGHLQKR